MSGKILTIPIGMRCRH